MLRTNLSTRPFYNIRAAQVTLGGLALLVAVFTLINVVQVVRLRSSERALGARATQAESEAARLHEEAQRVRSKIDASELAQVAAATREANGIIDLRVFSWSDLFSSLERALPESVRVTSFQPREDRDGRFILSVRVQARRVQDLESFMDALEKTGRFRDVLTAEQQTDPEGAINALVESSYTPPDRSGQPPAADAPARGAAE